MSVLAAVAMVAAGCGGSEPKGDGPGLAPRGETQTTVKPTRQNLANRLSLAGTVTMNPTFGIVAPVRGQVRFFDVQAPLRTPTQPTRVASIWANGKPKRVNVPAGATFAGRLVEDRSTVVAGMPIVSAKLVGYGIVAEIDGAQAYRVSDALHSVQVQIKNGPGPFPCTVLGTIAALPAGTVPEPPQPTATSTPKSPDEGMPPQFPGASAPPEQEGSEPSGLRLVCTAAAGVKLINGASATLEVVTEQATNALVVPVEAVAGSQGRGRVDVVGPDRGRVTKDVVLGLTDGKVVQIKSGLTGSETLAVPGPNLPPAPPAEGKPEGPR
jgi:hypothetical protein